MREKQRRQDQQYHPRERVSCHEPQIVAVFSHPKKQDDIPREQQQNDSRVERVTITRVDIGDSVADLCRVKSQAVSSIFACPGIVSIQQTDELVPQTRIRVPKKCEKKFAIDGEYLEYVLPIFEGLSDITVKFTALIHDALPCLTVGSDCLQCLFSLCYDLIGIVYEVRDECEYEWRSDRPIPPDPQERRDTRTRDGQVLPPKFVDVPPALDDALGSFYDALQYFTRSTVEIIPVEDVTDDTFV